MANNALIIQRLFSQDGIIQNVDILVNNGSDYYVWTAHNINVADSDTVVQTFLTSNVTTYIAEILASGTQPLSADEKAQYQDIIDAAALQTDIDMLQANNQIAKVGGSVPNDPNVPTGGYKDVFKPSGTYSGMANATKFAVVGTAVFFILDSLIEVNKVVILLSRIALRKARSGTNSAQMVRKV